MQHLADSLPLPSPTQGPISICITTVRGLAPSAKNIHRAFRDTGRHIARINGPRRDTVRSEWSMYTRRYKTIIDESDVAAGKLAAVINGASTYANGPCANLRNDVEACYLKLTDLKSDTSVNARASLLNAPSDAKVACSQAFSENRGQSETTVQGSAPATTTPKGMWDLFTERLPTFYTMTSPQSPPAVENANLTPAQAAAVGIFAQAAPSHIHVQQRQHMPVTTGYARSQTQVSSILDKPHTDVVIASMKDIMLSLATQAPQLDVFRELTLHLKNEIKAYLQALQSANAFPTLDKRTALANMQARVALSSIHWRENDRGVLVFVRCSPGAHEQSHLSRISTSAPSCLASAL
ncbi:hypothetical protein ONZ51_g12336 [Trametes cubensis]|uniref:Uncharacterized protein n=1 Tax=Trametes cubensis TaxID=1111947 RepID=A0AAD7TIG2_9APHY|nr:hypothetical protein ONZ51_g12336 [Trametes cubensis]